MLESVIGPGQGPAMHLHRKHVEAFYVLDGALDIRAGEATVPAPAGSFVLYPAGSPHTFSNPGPGDARFFGFAAPGGIDRFLGGLGAILGQPGPPDVKALGELLRRFESEAVMGEIPDGPASTVLGPGSFVLVPPETVHTFSNPSDRPVRFLSLMSPGGFEQYFRDLQDAFGDGPPDVARIGEIAARYDVDTVAH